MPASFHCEPNCSRLLIAIPAYNEEKTIADVVTRVRLAMPSTDLIVVNDGSRDRTGAILADLKVQTATHLCNLGYSSTIVTAIKYALKHRYDALITLDADGQHLPEQLSPMVHEFQTSHTDYLIGSRYVSSKSYSGAPLGRRIAMLLFSLLTRIMSGHRIYDTTSGLKILRSTVFRPLTEWHFVDFHAEAIVYLSLLGLSVSEFPITIRERMHGQSMYSFKSAVSYPLKTFVIMMLAIVQAFTVRKGQPK